MRIPSVTLCLVIAAISGCGGDSRPAAEVSKEQALRQAGLGYMADELQPWRTTIESGSFLAPGQFTNQSDAHELTLDLSIVTENSRPKKSLSGVLIVRGQDGQVIYREPYTFEPDQSFGSHVYDRLSLRYDDGDANHRALRHGLQNRAEFLPQRVAYADGTVQTDGFGQSSLLDESPSK